MREIDKRIFPLVVISLLGFGCNAAFSNEAIVEAELAFLHARQLDAQKRFPEALIYYEKACTLVDKYKKLRCRNRRSEVALGK